jgi:hypothetical protein
MDRSLGLSAAPTFGAATGSTKAGNRERKSWETRRRAYRWRRGRGAAGFEVNAGGFFFCGRRGPQQGGGGALASKAQGGGAAGERHAREHAARPL